MAEKLGVKIGIEPGTSERELERKIREKYKNVNINVGVTPASTGTTQQYVRQTTRGMQDINTVIAKVIASYGRLNKMQEKVGKISFSSLSNQLRLDSDLFKNQGNNALKYLMGLQNQIDNMSYDELTVLLKELQNSEKILRPAVDAMHKQQKASIDLHNQQKKAREEAAKAAQKAQQAQEKAAKAAEKERVEIIKTQQSIKQKATDLRKLRIESGLEQSQLDGITRLDQYASGAANGADFDWLLQNMDDPNLGLTLNDYKQILSDINKEYTNQKSQISSIRREVAENLKLTASEEKELRDKEKALQNILTMQERLVKLIKQAQYSGVSLDLDESLYQTANVASAQDLLDKNPAIMTLEHMKQLEADLANTLGLGNAKYSAFKRIQETSTQMSNLNHQIDQYIENNSKITKNKALYAQLHELHNEIKSGSINVEEAQNRWAGLQAQFAELGLETYSLSKRLIKLFTDHFNTAIAMAGLHALQTAMRGILQSVVEIDTAMTELKKVTDLTDLAYEQFLDRAIDKATVLGAKVSDVLRATADFARLGWSPKEAEELADAAIIYKNVGDGITDISVASQSIISTMKAFGYSASEAIEIVNKFNYVGNNFAVTSADIGEALQRSASALEQSNNDLDKSIALIVAGNATVQNADVVGTALKTLSLRLTTTKTELEALGEDTDGAAESTSEYRSEILAITKAAGSAVDIMNETGTAYKSTYQILDELSKVWDNISQKEQQSLLYMLGGARQANTLSSILKNFADARAVVQQLEEGMANNSAVEENERYLDSINGKIEQLRANFQALSDDLLDSEVVKGALDIANAFVKVTDSIVEVTDVLPMLIAGFTGLMAANGKTFFRPGYFQTITKDFDTFKKHVRDFNFKNLSLYGLNFDGKRQGDIVQGLSSLIRRPLAKDETLEGRISSAFDSQKIWMEPDIAEESRRIIAKYGHDVDAVTSKLDNFSKSLTGMPPKVIKLTAAMKSAAVQFVAVIAVTAALKGIGMAIDHIFTTVEEHQEKIDEYNTSISEATSEWEKLRQLESNGTAISPEDKARMDYLEEYIDLLTKRRQREEQLKARKDLTSDGNPFTHTTYDDIQAALNSRNANLLSNYADWVPNVKDADLKISATAQADAYYSALTSEQAFLQQQKYAVQTALAAEDNLVYQQKYQLLLTDIEQQIIRNDEAIQKANKSGIISLGIVDKTHTAVQELAKVNSWNLFDSIAGAEGTTLTSINSEIDEMQSAFNTLIAAKEEYDAHQSYSLDTLQALSNLDSKYLNLLIDEKGRLELNTEAMNNLAQARINEFRIKIMTDAAQQIQNLIDTGNATAWLAQQQADLNIETYEGAKATLALAAGQAMLMGGDMATAAQMIMNQTNALLNAVGSWDAYGASGSAALNKINDAAEKARKEAEDNLRKQGEAALAALDKKKKALQDELDALEEVYEAEDRELELQKRINAYQRAQAARTVRLYTHDKGWQWVADPAKVKEAQDAVEEYQKEIRREEAKKAIQDQIDAIDDLRDKVQEAMNAIGNDYINNRNNLALMAELEGMTLDQLGGWVNNYATNVINANSNIAASYDTAAAHAAAYFKTVKEESVVPETPAQTSSYDIMDGERAYWDEFGSQQRPWKSGIGPQVRHKGGLIQGMSTGAHVSVEFDKYIKKLKSDEVPAILQAGEYVLTKQHQADILNERANLINSVRAGRMVTLEIGDIVINQPMGSVESLSKAIIQKLPTQVMRDLYVK